MYGIAIIIVFNIGHRQDILFLNYLLTKHTIESVVEHILGKGGGVFLHSYYGESEVVTF